MLQKAAQRETPSISSPKSGEAVSGPSLLGARLRAARQARRIGLRSLAKRLGVSASLISQVENGKVMPSVATLYAIARELGISMDELFSGEEKHRRPAKGGEHVQRVESRDAIDLASGVRWERLTAGHDPGVSFQMTAYEVGAESCDASALMSHAGTEYGYLLSGRLGLTIGRESYELRPGDSVSFPSTTPHRLWNAGGEPAEAVWVVVGREQDMHDGR